LGHVAVLVFFVLSGVLIAESAERRRGAWGAFVRARARRLLPGLAGALIAGAALAIAFGATAGPGEVAIYILRGIGMVSLEFALAGAWDSNPIPSIVNGPL